MHAYRELQRVRITSPLTGPDVFDAGRIHKLPAGQAGTVLHVYADGRALEVEFVLGVPRADGVIEAPRFCQLTLTPDQVQPVH